MLSFEDWHPEIKNPWLVVGKGPTASLVDLIDKASMDVLTLNDAIRIVPHARIAHLIDVEVFARCQDDLLAKSDFLLLPRVLHQECKRKVPVEVFTTMFMGAREFEEQGRLVVYDKWPRSITDPGRPKRAVACRYFSCEAGLSILGELGAKRVVTIGVDGGSQYAPAFQGLTPLENGRSSFDAQEAELQAIATHYGMEVTPWI